MTDASLAPRPRVLVDLLPRTLVVDIVAVAVSIAFVGVLAQIALPLWPVPVTGQTLGVLLVGATLGSVRGAIALSGYALLGIVGVPLFTDASSGWSVIIGPTGGYIIGFIAAAAIVGRLAETSWVRRLPASLLVFAAGSLIIFGVGLPWLAVFLGSIGAPNDLASVLNAGLYPFLLGELGKSLIAGVALPLTWKLASRPRSS